MDKELEKILIFTYNPKGRLKNCNIEEIENTKVFDWFRTKKHIIVEKNQVILIYISKPIQEIKYLTKVIDINKDTIKLKLIKKFNKLEKVIKSRLVLYTIMSIFGTTKGIEKVHVDDIIKLCDNNIGNKYLTPNKNIKVFVKDHKIYFLDQR